MKKVSHDDFTEALARQLKADAILIDSRLEDFIESLKAALEKDGKVTLEGFGTFILTDGEITLEPDETLALEINYKYAGMAAIELTPAYAKKLKAEEDDDDTEKEEISATDKPLTPLQPSKEETEGKHSTSEETGQPDEATADEDPFNLSNAAGEKAQKQTAASKEPADQAPKKLPKKPAPVTGKKESANKVKGGDQQPQKSSNKLLYTLAAMAAVMLIAMYINQAGITIPFDMPGYGETREISLQETQTDRQLPESSHELRQGGESEATATDSAEPTGTYSATITTTLEVPDEEPLAYGLHGDLIEADSAVTIVVHSLPNYRMGSAERDNLRKAGYRATLHSVTMANGRDTWRVGIGQFASIEDAENAVNELEEPYKSSHFIARIRK